MTIRTLCFALGSFLMATPAMAASDVTVDVRSDANVPVYSATGYDVVVRNIGNKSASNVSVTVQLPVTHTSPQVYIMGNLGFVDSRCTRSGTRLTCALGTVNKGASKTVVFDLALPQSAAPLVVSATVTTTSAENSTSNNADSDTATQSFYSWPIAEGDVAVNRHCTGTGLTAFFECELFPSSISFHDIVFHTDGTISIPIEPAYSGTWSRPTADSLEVIYTYNGGVEAEFFGQGVDGDCYEGLTTFPGSTYVSPYEVCLQ